MRTHYAIAAGWLIAFVLGIVPAQISNVVAINQSVTKANVPADGAARVQQEVVPDMRGCDLRPSAATEGPQQHSIQTTAGCLVSS